MKTRMAAIEPRPSVLVVEDSEAHAHVIEAVLHEAGYDVASCESCVRAYEAAVCADPPFGVVVVDLLIGGDFEAAFDLIVRLRKTVPSTRTIVLSAHGTARNAVRAVKAGAFDFVEKEGVGPLDPRLLASNLLPRVRAATTAVDPAARAQHIALLRRLSEDELIMWILVPLLKEMGFLGVKASAFHGPQECGQDIRPFLKYGDFNERVYFCAQVKCGRISARSGTSHHVSRLLDQVRLALATSFVDRLDGTRKRVDRCLVFCVGRMTADARRAIEEASEGTRAVVVLGVEELYDLLEREGMLAYVDGVSREMLRRDQDAS